LLTTRGEEQYVQKDTPAGCSDYLTKPVNDVELLDLLKAYWASNEERPGHYADLTQE